MEAIKDSVKSSVSSYKLKKSTSNEVWINEASGEKKEFTVVTKEIVDTEFYKVWLYDLINVLDILGSKKIKILTHILENINPYDNTFGGTIREIAKDTASSTKTVQEVINVLLEVNFFSKVRIATYRVNPSVILKGSHKKRLGLMINYQSERNKENE